MEHMKNAIIDNAIMHDIVKPARVRNGLSLFLHSLTPARKMCHRPYSRASTIYWVFFLAPF